MKKLKVKLFKNISDLNDFYSMLLGKPLIDVLYEMKNRVDISKECEDLLKLLQKSRDYNSPRNLNSKNPKEKKTGSIVRIPNDIIIFKTTNESIDDNKSTEKSGEEMDVPKNPKQHEILVKDI